MSTQSLWRVHHPIGSYLVSIRTAHTRVLLTSRSNSILSNSRHQGPTVSNLLLMSASPPSPSSQNSSSKVFKFAIPGRSANGLLYPTSYVILIGLTVGTVNVCRVSFVSNVLANISGDDGVVAGDDTGEDLDLICERMDISSTLSPAAPVLTRYSVFKTLTPGGRVPKETPLMRPDDC